MKKYFFAALIAAITSSCEKYNTDAYTNGCIVQYKVTLRDNNAYGKYLLENIEKNVSNSAKATAYHKLTNAHSKYLDSIMGQVNKNSGEIFFEGNEYSQTGKEFISRTNTFEKDILQLVSDENLKKRIHYILNTNDLEQASDIAANNDQDIHKTGGISTPYLEYYFRGLSNEYIELVLSIRKRNLLELENEFLISEKHSQ